MVARDGSGKSSGLPAATKIVYPRAAGTWVAVILGPLLVLAAAALLVYDAATGLSWSDVSLPLGFALFSYTTVVAAR
jgi:hypothetical protein